MTASPMTVTTTPPGPAAARLDVRDRAPSGVAAEGLGKQFGSQWAVRDLDLDVPAGTVLGLLGHNGAGKTTTLRMLTTLSRPTTGRATVAGFDVATEAHEVRRTIGVAAQQATVDGLLTARANLEMIGRLHGLRRGEARRQADALLGQLDLAGSADALARTLSGGMRRRLDLAASLVAEPAVLFLDEPTTGLDPRSRAQLWDLLRSLVADGTTIILTTQYLDEADRLADDIVVLDHGRAVAHGTPAQLKASLAGDRIEITLSPGHSVAAARAALGPLLGPVEALDDTDDNDAGDGRGPVLGAALPAGLSLVAVLRALADAGIDATDVSRHQPTLDDVFLTLTQPDQPDRADQQHDSDRPEGQPRP